jgi:hypothetical protein
MKASRIGNPIHIKVAPGARTCAGRYRSTFEEILQISIVVVIQTAYRDALSIALQFAAHGTILPAVVGLDCETTVGQTLKAQKDAARVHNFVFRGSDCLWANIATARVEEGS